MRAPSAVWPAHLFVRQLSSAIDSLLRFYLSRKISSRGYTHNLLSCRFWTNFAEAMDILNWPYVCWTSVNQEIEYAVGLISSTILRPSTLICHDGTHDTFL